MSEKVCNGCGSKEESSFAKELLTGYKKQFKAVFIALMIVIFLWFSTIAMFVYYISQYDFSSYTVEGIQDGGGTNIIGGGNIAYGSMGENNR